MIKTNFHTHTIFCDGKDTAEEMVIAAIEKGFTKLGFSGHSYVTYGDSFGMNHDVLTKYKSEINRLKEKYKDKIKIYCGIELDYYSNLDISDFEYVIASVHGVEKNGVIYEVDHSVEVFKQNVSKGWNGDYYAFAKDYFDTVSNQQGDIIGHIDLLTKFNQDDCLFSTKDARYLASAEKAVKKLCEKELVFEINTGAISRGYRLKPYPSEDILKMIKKHKGKIIITSDCHNKDFIDCGFDIAYKLALKCGFKELYNPFEDENNF